MTTEVDLLPGTICQKQGSQANHKWSIRLYETSVLCWMVLVVHWNPSHPFQSNLHFVLHTSQLEVLQGSYFLRGAHFIAVFRPRLLELPVTSANRTTFDKRLRGQTITLDTKD